MTLANWPFGDLEPGKYRAIVIDPPWRMAMGTKGRPQHYPRMPDCDIAALPLADLAHPDGAFLFVWITSPLTERFWVNIWPSWKAQRWRFSARAFEWIKTKGGTKALFYDDGQFHIGMGLTTRKNAEDCMLFKIRKANRLRTDIRELIVSPVREHSRKPDESYERIEQFCAGPYAEIFGRQSRPGWGVFGNEAGKFDAPFAEAAE